MAVKTGPGQLVAAITGPPGPLVGETSLRMTEHREWVLNGKACRIQATAKTSASKTTLCRKASSPPQ